jgi:hypothetical protein
MSNPSAYSGNGSIYKDGFAMGQNAALKQNEMNNAIGGKRRRRGTRTKRRQIYNGGAETVVQPVHAAYPNSGIQGLNRDLTAVTAQQSANGKYDGNVASGGSVRRRRRSLKRKTNRRRMRRSLRKSRRHM